ncbi:MAG: bifunctional 4-hydroxy-3-methylbut-2-enyl diphosphate reductase/30S ribosomal protein S1 [Eubacterium sp.]|nr:bifunctional 4-hydroxy-3-methylbut-2-enyl diphosphate reductase/30S ribosomal protein S1 [Eubacterium sp.]
MEVILAEKAGFCFGVKRAVDTAFEQADKASNAVFTFGPIIHNEDVTEKLALKGVNVINSIEELDDLPENSSIIIRSHGVGEDIFESIKSRGFSIVDATCPFVNNIHKIVRERSEAGDEILIIGNPGHAEVEGTIGWSRQKPYVINSVEDIEALPDSLNNASITVVAQTTYSLKKFQELVAELQDRYYNVNVCKTICNATEERQKEAQRLASSVDSMIVIGGKNSSNTQKLYEISKQQCNNTYYIQTLVDLDLTVFESASRVGITAGASTPNYIIKEVQDSMSEKSFEELLNDEETVSIKKGKIIDGKVISVKPEEMVVDIHYKSDGILTAAEYSNSPVDLTTVVKEGDPITVEVIKPNDGEGSVLLSYKSILANEAYKELEEAFENGTVLTGKVDKVLKGGLSVIVKECRVFVPASLVSDTFERDLSKYEGQEIEFVLTEFDLHRKRVIGDRKQLIIKNKEAAASELFSKIKVGDVVEGTIKNITEFGAFVDLGGADGLLHISEMSWGRVEKPKKIFTVGQSVKCFIKEINGNKIALSMKFEDQNPWLTAEEKYAKGTIVKGKVARMTDFGAFVVLEPGIDALLHVSQISLDHIEKPSDVLKSGQEIEAKVVDIKIPERKISLSIKALLIDQMPKEEKEEKKEDEVVIPEEEEIKESIPVDEVLAEAAPVEEEAPAEEAPAEKAPAEDAE